jgi:hypothetical protein
MVEGSEDFRFTLEPREAFGVTRDRRGEHLDRDLALQIRVRRLIYLPHAAFPQKNGHVIRAEAGAGDQGQTVGSIPLRSQDAITPV